MRKLAKGIASLLATAGMLFATTAFAADAPVPYPAQIQPPGPSAPASSTPSWNPPPAFAAGGPVSYPAQIQPSSPSAVAQTFPPIGPSGVHPPSSFWNLSGNPYKASFSGVSNIGIYTNYYFSTNGAGDLDINDINLYGDNAKDVPCQIDLYDRTTHRKLVYTYFTTDTGNVYSISYTDLNPYDFYYIGIKADAINKTIDGHFRVAWN